MFVVTKEEMENVLEGCRDPGDMQSRLRTLRIAHGPFYVEGFDPVVSTGYRHAKCNNMACSVGDFSVTSHIACKDVRCPGCDSPVGHKNQTGVFCPPPVFDAEVWADTQDEDFVVAYTTESFGRNPDQGRFAFETGGGDPVSAVTPQDIKDIVNRALTEFFDGRS